MSDQILFVIGLIGVALFWFLLYDSRRFVVVSYTFADPRIRRAYRAVVLADLHNRQYGKDNAFLLKAVREQSPDGIFIAGDMLTAKAGEDFAPALALLKELARDYPVYYAYGNHEQRLCRRPQVYGTMALDYETALGELGVRRLHNAHAALPEINLTVYGLEIGEGYYRRGSSPPMEETYLTGLLGRPEPGSCRLLLAHHPDYFPQYARWGADVVFAGHIHGGIVRLPFGRGVLSPSMRLFPRYDGGEFREGNSTMYLSRGIGMHTIPLRLFNPSEVLVVDFLPK
ncbi:MAG: metallophosphoesterase [Clostridium sp.]|jgi:predicted MPP superfamily phosphohydrolase|nr:metallophosphoesterase [Clostridium sp.]